MKKIVYCGILLILIMSSYSISSISSEVDIFPNLIFKNVPGQCWILDNLNSTYLVIILFQLSETHSILFNSSLLYSCFNHSEIEYLALFVNVGEMLSSNEHIENSLEYKLQLYNISPHYYFGYCPNEADNNKMVDLLHLDSGGYSPITIIIIELVSLEILYLDKNQDFLFLWNQLTQLVSPIYTPTELLIYSGHGKNKSVLVYGFKEISLLVMIISLVFFRKKRNEK